MRNTQDVTHKKGAVQVYVAILVPLTVAGAIFLFAGNAEKNREQTDNETAPLTTPATTEDTVSETNTQPLQPGQNTAPQRENPTPAPAPQGGTALIEGVVTNINLSPIPFGKDAKITVFTSAGVETTLFVPPPDTECAANNLALNTLSVGSLIEAYGKKISGGSVRPCDSSAHYIKTILKPKEPLVPAGFSPLLLDIKFNTRFNVNTKKEAENRLPSSALRFIKDLTPLTQLPNTQELESLRGPLNSWYRAELISKNSMLFIREEVRRASAVERVEFVQTQ